VRSCRSVESPELRSTADTEAISLTLAGHGSSVASVSAHPTSPLLVLSASYDGNLRIWDARSPNQALFTIPRQASETQSGLSDQLKRLKGPEKVLCCDWDGSMVGSGGEDKALQLYRTTV
jgi:ribosome biogenesis protein YTM1